MDSAGFVVVHRDWTTYSHDSARSSVEHVHITVKEPHIAQDIITRHNLMVNYTCVNLEHIHNQHSWTVRILTATYYMYSVSGSAAVS